MQTLDLRDRTNMFYWQTNRKITAQQQKEVFLDRYQMVKSEEAKDAIEYGMGTVGKSNRDKKVVELSEPIEFGSVNTVRMATLADGTKLVVRMHPHFVKNGYFWVEGLATAEAKKLGVPVYDTYLVDDMMNKFSFAYMIMSALPGKTLKEYTDDPNFHLTERLVKETGRNVAKIHQFKPKGFGRVSPIEKKTSRINLVLAEKVPGMKRIAKQAKKTEKTPAVEEKQQVRQTEKKSFGMAQDKPEVKTELGRKENVLKNLGKRIFRRKVV